MRRRHETIAHTADVGLRASAEELPALFEEAALALAEVSAERDEGGVAKAGSAGLGAVEGETIELEADDLVGLAYAWLNELIGRAQAAEQALVVADVSEIAPGPPVPGTEGAGWRLRGRVRFAPYGEEDGATVRPRHDVKSATYHRLSVRRQRRGWTLTVYLDV